MSEESKTSANDPDLAYLRQLAGSSAAPRLHEEESQQLKVKVAQLVAKPDRRWLWRIAAVVVGLVCMLVLGWMVATLR
jgi:hypothetical protein